jgi:hypothetical protein
MMRRRTPLVLRESFFWLSTPLTVNTNSLAVLNGLEQTGLVAHKNLPQQEHGLLWEIAAEIRSAPLNESWHCQAVLDTHSVYLSMGPQQWFALDLETGHGSGFVSLEDLNCEDDWNVNMYLRAIVDNISSFLRDGAGKTI